MKNEVFSKEKFVKVMTEYKKLNDLYNKIDKAAKRLIFFKIYPIEHEELILEVLKEAFNDESDWIGYFIFELDFGKKWTKDSVSDNGKIVVLKTFKDLYDLLVGSPKYLE